MKKFTVLAVMAFAVWFFQYEPAAHWRGMPAPKDPVQTAASLPAPFAHGDYTVTPLARYELSAVVLGRERYRFDHGSDLAPVDLALGWGPMSVAAVINEIKISQSGRWYEYRYGEPPLDPALIASHSANTHCLPADATVRDQLLAVQRHDLVALQGYLVAIVGPDGYHWDSSLSREDTGAHSCEVFWITAVSRRRL